MDKIIARVAKLALSYTLKARITALVEQAYEQGCKDTARDIRMELAADKQHAGAQLVEANWAM